MDDVKINWPKEWAPEEGWPTEPKGLTPNGRMTWRQADRVLRKHGSSLSKSVASLGAPRSVQLKIERFLARPLDAVEQQIEELTNLGPGALLEKALESMCALIRQAESRKYLRTYSLLTNFPEEEQPDPRCTFDLRDRFLAALVVAELATVERCTYDRVAAQYCGLCGHEMDLIDEDCFDCGGYGIERYAEEVWCLVRYGSYEFPTDGRPSNHMMSVAAKVEEEDLDDLLVGNPNFDLRAGAQLACVRMATACMERLRESTSGNVLAGVRGLGISGRVPGRSRCE